MNTVHLRVAQPKAVSYVTEHTDHGKKNSRDISCSHFYCVGKDEHDMFLLFYRVVTRVLCHIRNGLITSCNIATAVVAIGEILHN